MSTNLLTNVTRNKKVLHLVTRNKRVLQKVTRNNEVLHVASPVSVSVSVSVQVPLPRKKVSKEHVHPSRPHTSEHDVQNAIVQAFFYRHRITLYHIDAGGAGFRSGSSKGHRGHSGIPAGFPDLLGVTGEGRAVFIEVKRPGERPRKNQQEFLARLRATNAIAFWADSVESALRQFEEAA